MPINPGFFSSSMPQWARSSWPWIKKDWTARTRPRTRFFFSSWARARSGWTSIGSSRPPVSDRARARRQVLDRARMSCRSLRINPTSIVREAATCRVGCAHAAGSTLRAFIRHASVVGFAPGDPAERKSPLTKREMIETILDAKGAKGVSWAEIAKAVGLSEVYTTSACQGENSLSSEEAGKLAGLLGLNAFVTEALTRPATKGEAAMTVPKEPLQYRFQEILYVYGGTLKELIEEKFRPGIMSAIDFTLSIEKQPDPKGDRVVITMNGEFLPCKKW